MRYLHWLLLQTEDVRDAEDTVVQFSMMVREACRQREGLREQLLAAKHRDDTMLLLSHLHLSAEQHHAFLHTWHEWRRSLVDGTP